MQSVIESAQGKCQLASRLSYILKNSEGKIQINFAVSNVYEAIRHNNIPELIEQVEALDRIYANLRFKV